jgi:MoxR-like ATPase
VKLSLEEIKIGALYEATFLQNPIADSEFKFRATHLDGKRAPKVVLSSDARIVPGIPCLVKVDAVKNVERPDRGSIEVSWAGPAPLKIEGLYLDPIVGKKLQILLESGLNILLDGPQGCGKTVLARAIAERLGMEFVFFNCGSVVDAVDFFATIQVRASESGAPVTDFVKTDLLLALEAASEEPHKRFLAFLDELNRCPESARNALMPALDTSRRFYHPIQARFVAIPDNVQFVAAVNRGRQFSGTFGIDAAQLDRFAPLEMDYPPPQEEEKILRTRHPELGKGLIEKVVEIAHALRTSTEIDVTLSVRATDEACTYLKHPLIEADAQGMLAEVLKSSFCGRLSGRYSDTASDAGAAWALIRAKLS